MDPWTVRSLGASLVLGWSAPTRWCRIEEVA